MAILPPLEEQDAVIKDVYLIHMGRKWLTFVCFVYSVGQLSRSSSLLSAVNFFALRKYLVFAAQRGIRQRGEMQSPKGKALYEQISAWDSESFDLPLFDPTAEYLSLWCTQCLLSGWTSRYALGLQCARSSSSHCGLWESFHFFAYCTSRLEQLHSSVQPCWIHMLNYSCRSHAVCYCKNSFKLRKHVPYVWFAV